MIYFNFENKNESFYYRIYGMVIGTGCDCQMDKWKKKTVNKQGITDQIIEKFSVILIVILTLISILMRILIQEKSIDDYLDVNDIDTPNIRIDIRSFWIQFIVSALPLHIFAVSDILQLLQAKQLQKKYSNEIQIKNIASLENIAYVDWCLFDKTQTLTQNNFEIEGLIIDQSFFNATKIKNLQQTSLNKETNSEYENPLSNKKFNNLFINSNQGHKLKVTSNSNNSLGGISSGSGVFNLKNKMQMVQMNTSEFNHEQNNQQDNELQNENQQQKNIKQQGFEEFQNEDFQLQLQDKMRQIKLQIEKIDEAGESILANSSQVDSTDRYQIQQKGLKFIAKSRNSQYGGTNKEDTTINRTHRFSKQNQLDDQFSNLNCDINLSRQPSFDHKELEENSKSKNSFIEQQSNNLERKNSQDKSPLKQSLDSELKNEKRIKKMSEQIQFQSENQDFQQQQKIKTEAFHSDQRNRKSDQQIIKLNTDSSEGQDNSICESSDKGTKKFQQIDNEDCDEEEIDIASEGNRKFFVKSFQLHFEGGISLPNLDTDRTAFPLSTRNLLSPSQNYKIDEEMTGSNISNLHFNYDFKTTTMSISTLNKGYSKHQRKVELSVNTNNGLQIISESENQNSNFLTNKYENYIEDDENKDEYDSHIDGAFTSRALLQNEILDKENPYFLSNTKQLQNNDNLDNLQQQLEFHQKKINEERCFQENNEEKIEINFEQKSNLLYYFLSKQSIQINKANYQINQFLNQQIQLDNINIEEGIKSINNDKNYPNEQNLQHKSQQQQNDYEQNDQQDEDSSQCITDQVKENNPDNEEDANEQGHRSNSSSGSQKMNKSCIVSSHRLSKFAQQSMDFSSNESIQEIKLQSPIKLSHPSRKRNSQEIEKLNNSLKEQQSIQIQGFDENAVDKNDHKNEIKNENGLEYHQQKQNDNQNGNQINQIVSPLKEKQEALYKRYAQQSFYINTGKTISFQQIGSGFQSFNEPGEMQSIENILGPDTPVDNQQFRSQNITQGYNIQQEQKIREQLKMFGMQTNNSHMEFGETNSSRQIQTPKLQGNGDSPHLFRLQSKDINQSPLMKNLVYTSSQFGIQNMNHDFSQSKNIESLDNVQQLKLQLKESSEHKNMNQLEQEGIELAGLREINKYSSDLLKNLYDSDFSHYIQIEDFQIQEKEQLIQKELKKYDNFMKAVMLCRQWKLKVIPNSDYYSIEFLKPEDESISRFFRHLRISLQVGTKRELEGKCFFHLPNLNENNKLQIIVQNSPSIKKPNTSFAIVQDHFSGTYTLFVKGDAHILEKMKLKTHQKQILTEYFDSKMELGQRVQVYGQKPLQYKDVSNFLIRYHQLKASHFDDQIRQHDELFEEIEYDLEYLGVLFMSNNLNNGVVDYVSQLDNLSIKMGILSGDIHDFVMQTAKSSSILEDEMEHIKIEGENHDDIESSIKQHISQIKKKMFKREDDNEVQDMQTLQQEEQTNKFNKYNTEKDKNKMYNKRQTKSEHYNFVNNAIIQLEKRVIIIKGSQLKMISTDPTLEAHFIFLIANADRIIGSELTAIQKGYFIEMIKHIDDTFKIMSIGDGYNDCLMMQLSDISIELSSSNSFQLQQQNQQKQAFQNKSQNQNIKNKETINQYSSYTQKIIQIQKEIQLNVQEVNKKRESVILTQEVIERKTKMSNNSGDILFKTPDFSLLQKFFLQESFNLSRKKYFLIVEAFYQSFLFLILNFSLNISTLSSSALFTSDDYVILHVFLFGFKLVFFGNMYNNQLISIITKKYAPNIYNFNNPFYQRASSSISFFLISIIPAIFDGILILLIATYSQSINDQYELLRSFVFFNMIIVNSIRLHNNIPDENLRNLKKDFSRQQSKSSNKSNNSNKSQSNIQKIINSKSDKNLIKSRNDQAVISLDDNILKQKKQQKQLQSLLNKSIFKFFKSSLIQMLVFDVIIYFGYFGFSYQYSIKQSESLQQAFDIGELMQYGEFYLGFLLIICISKIFHYFYQDFLVKNYLDKDITILLNLFSHKNVIWRNLYFKAQNMIRLRVISIENVIKKLFTKVKMDINIEQILSPDDYHSQMEQDEYNKYTLDFISKKLMAQHNKIIVPVQIKQARTIITALIILNIFLIIFTSILDEPFDLVTIKRQRDRIISLLLLIIFTVLLLFFVIILYTKASEEKFQYINISILTYFGLYEIIYSWAFDQVLTFNQLIIFLIISFLPIPIHLTLIHHIIISLNQIIWYLVKQSCNDSSCYLVPVDDYSRDFTKFKTYLFMNIFSFYIHITLNSFLGKYYFTKNQNTHYLQIRRLKEEKSESSDIIGLLLPEFVKDEVIQCQGEYLIEKSSDNVLILFCDIYQFDKILSEEKERITELLDTLFRQFDMLCKQEGIQKIETVGKTYMACGGLKDIEKRLPKETLKQDVSERIVNLAIQMILRASLINWGENYEHQGVALKIGINSGPVIAGVIGLHKPQFSLIGDTVNTTSRICANCNQGQISISQKVYERVKGIKPEWGFKQHSFEAKGKGTLVCYYINLRDESALTQPLSGLKGGQNTMLISRTPLVLMKSLSNQEKFIHGIQNGRNLYNNLQSPSTRGGIGGLSSHSLQLQQNKQIKLKDIYLNDKIIRRNQNKKKSTVYLNDLLDEDVSPRYKQNYYNNDFSPSHINNMNKDNNHSLDESIRKYHNDDFIRESLDQHKQVSNQLVPKTVVFTSVDTPLKSYKKRFVQETSVQVQLKTNEDRVSQNGLSETPSKTNSIKNQPQSLGSQQQQGQVQITPQYQKNMVQQITDLEESIDENEDKLYDNVNSRSLIFNQKSSDGQPNRIIVNRFLQFITGDDKQYLYDYEEQTLQAYWTPFKILIISTIFVNFLHTILKLFSKSNNTSQNSIWYAIDLTTQASFFIFLVVRDILVKKKKMRLVFLIIINISFLSIIGDASQQNDESMLIHFSIMRLTCNFYLIDHSYCLQFIEQFILSVMWGLVYLFWVLVPDNKFSIQYFYLLICPIFFLLYQRYNFIKTEITSYNQRSIAIEQNSKQLKLLQFLLPPHILEKFFKDTTKRSELTHRLKNVPILVADIAGFTAYSNSVQPTQVVKMLYNLFIKFDLSCKKHQVFKLYTIGDCYMVLGFNNQTRNQVTEAYNTLEMAFSMVKIIQKVKKEINFEGLNMRIGLHIGDIIGGVIGTDIVRYDVYGKDVVIANKMESNSTTGRIRISEAYKKILLDNYSGLYEFEDEQTVECPSIDHIVQSWLVYKKDEA